MMPGTFGPVERRAPAWMRLGGVEQVAHVPNYCNEIEDEE
jgi:hypothetical protein